MRLTADDRETIKACLRIEIANLRALAESTFESGKTARGGFPLVLASYERVLAKMESK